MAVSEELLEILVCPETKQPVAPASEEVLRKLGEEIAAGRVRNRGGDQVSEPVTIGSPSSETSMRHSGESGMRRPISPCRFRMSRGTSVLASRMMV